MSITTSTMDATSSLGCKSGKSSNDSRFDITVANGSVTYQMVKIVIRWRVTTNDTTNNKCVWNAKNFHMYMIESNEQQISLKVVPRHAKALSCLRNRVEFFYNPSSSDRRHQMRMRKIDNVSIASSAVRTTAAVDA